MFNVMGFGAVGDGVADDTAALQHALAAGNGILRMNKGTYRITQPLVLDLAKQGYGAVRGDGCTSRIVMSGPGPAIRVLGDHQGTAAPDSVQARTGTWRGFPPSRTKTLARSEKSESKRFLSICNRAMQSGAARFVGVNHQ